MNKRNVARYWSFLLLMLLIVNALSAQMSEETVASAEIVASTKQKVDTLEVTG